MTALLDFHSVAQFSSLRIVDSLVGGTIISGFAAALLRVARRSNAGTRFAIWFAALVAIATLPFAGALSSHSTLSTIHPAVTVPDSWAYYVFGAWAIVATFFLIVSGARSGMCTRFVEIALNSIRRCSIRLCKKPCAVPS